MRIVSSTPQALNCWTVLLGSNLINTAVSLLDAHKQCYKKYKIKSFCEEKPYKDAQKRFFEVVGFNAADVVRSGAVESVHEHL